MPRPRKAKPVKRNQQCIPFFRGCCNKATIATTNTRWTLTASPRFTENKTHNKAKVVPKGGVGVSSSMIVVDQKEGDTYVSCSAVHVSKDC